LTKPSVERNFCWPSPSQSISVSSPNWTHVPRSWDSRNFFEILKLVIRLTQIGFEVGDSFSFYLSEPQQSVYVLLYFGDQIFLTSFQQSNTSLRMPSHWCATITSICQLCRG
jgi:hypothetical protein